MLMRNVCVTRYGMVALALCVIMHGGCRNDRRSSENLVQVVVTIPPLAEFVEQVSEGRAAVVVMVPPGASPHTYEPTPAQMALLANADLYVKMGTPIEFEIAWLDKLTAINRTMRVCDASLGIDRIIATEHDHDHGDHRNIDPHIWLSLQNARLMVRNIRDALCAIDPLNEAAYAKNAAAYCARLDSLDGAITRMLVQKERRMFIVYHSAWNYFARDYDMEQIAIETGGKEPSAKTIQRIIETARRFDIRIVFASPQFDRKYAESVARDIDGQVMLVDPLAENYIDNIGTIAAMLAHYME